MESEKKRKNVQKKKENKCWKRENNVEMEKKSAVKNH